MDNKIERVNIYNLISLLDELLNTGYFNDKQKLFKFIIIFNDEVCIIFNELE